jgi:hypothetical protein
MREEYAQLLPDWYMGDEEHDLVLSDDIDSLASCAVLNMVKGWKVGYFYDFNNIYTIQKDTTKKNRRCWVDIATYKGHAFDNHVSLISDWDTWNTDMINLNLMCQVTNENYTDKYAGSTLLTIWSVYNLPLPETEEGKMLLLCIDSAYKGFYSDRFHDIQKHYLIDVLGLEGLYSVIQRHTAEEFEDLILEYGLRQKITYYDRAIKTELPLDKIGQALGIDLNIMPESEFFLIRRLVQIQADIKEDDEYADDISQGIKTLAIVYRNKVKYSKIKERR